ncbi:MAG TPA: ABC transporter permease [Jatrophihabitantaceae bacterium]|jgi:ABC-2 type transport system permease protein|nr:ABC transporter permease [Jatrophihabitantaceae bacterium]
MSRARSVALGAARAHIELRQLRRTPREWITQFSTPVMFVLIASSQHSSIPNTTVSSAGLIIAGGVGWLIALLGLTVVPQFIATERAEGTLLRLRSLPRAMLPYLISKVIYICAIAVIGVALTLIGGALLASTPLPPDAAHWLTVLWVGALGLAAVVPIGVAIGAVLPNPREALALAMLPTLALVGISGVFFPITRLPDPVQRIAEVFPLKWIAQGMRSAMLPQESVAAETAHSWQHLPTAAVLAGWAIAGFVLGPVLLMRAARQESGSRLVSRREKVGA